MKITLDLMNDWWNEYNAKYFNNELRKPHFIIKNSKSYLGKAFGYKHNLIMSNYYDRSEFEYKNTFIHEMIHFWEFQNFGKAGHGYNFKMKASEINKDGWKIKRCSDVENKNLINLKHDSVYVVNFNYKDMNCFAKIPNSTARKVYMEYARNKYISNAKCYKVANSINLEKFNTCKSGHKYWASQFAQETFKPAIEKGELIWEACSVWHNN